MVGAHSQTQVTLLRNVEHSEMTKMNPSLGEMGGRSYGPELLALFTRCHTTLPVPQFLDYIRRFGQFSKSFLAKKVDRVQNPKVFDFVRYEQFGGVAPPPPIVTHPYRLSSYVRLMERSNLKNELLEQLRRAGAVAVEVDADRELEQRVLEARVAEQARIDHGGRAGGAGGPLLPKVVVSLSVGRDVFWSGRGLTSSSDVLLHVSGVCRMDHDDHGSSCCTKFLFGE